MKKKSSVKLYANCKAEIMLDSEDIASKVEITRLAVSLYGTGSTDSAHTGDPYFETRPTREGRVTQNVTSNHLLPKWLKQNCPMIRFSKNV